jgi:hypothetical protein
LRILLRASRSLCIGEGNDADDIDPIKLNKLAYLAIEEYDLPIIYGWYKYGPAPVNVAHQSVSTIPRSEDEIASVDEPRIKNVNYDVRSPEEYSYFYSDDLEEFGHVLEALTKEYLVEFYFGYAPEQYRDLYIASAEIQQVLDELKQGTEWYDKAAKTLDTLTKRYQRVMHEVHENPVLDESVELMRAYGELLMEVLVTTADLSDISESQQRFITRVVDYFYGEAWKYVALLVSRDTVKLSTGENKRKLLNSIEEDLRGIRTEYDDELRGLREQSQQFDLISSSQSAERLPRGGNEEGTHPLERGIEDATEGNTASMESILERVD